METNPIYRLRVPEVFRALETSPDGLNPGEVETRQSLYGSNQLSEPLPINQARRFLLSLTYPMALMLWAAGAIALTQQPALGIVIWGLVLVNGFFSFWREYRAEQAMKALHRLLPAYARMIRGGVEVSIPAGELVPGDVLVLAEGDNIPADARVVEEYGLRTNNATLTGEAVPARKSADSSLREGISELERPNLVFAGTSVVSGTGRAVVYSTGMLTQFGRIARLTQQVKEQPSPLQRELTRLTRYLALVALGLGTFVFLVGVTSAGIQWLDSFLLGVAVVVATLPEGLPATVTLSLAVAAQRLADQGVLVKKLSILETLGTISVIATDKSGTLTQNQMTVRELYLARQRISITGVGYEPKGGFSPSPKGKPYEADLHSLLTAALLSNNARLIPPSLERPQWSSLGDQTEAALKVAALKLGLDEQALNTRFPRLHENPFDARRKRMSTVHRRRMGSSKEPHPTDIVFVKGAPREILQLCTTIRIHGQDQPLDEKIRQEIIDTIDDYSRSTLRVLAFAQREIPSRAQTRALTSGASHSSEQLERQLAFLGLMAMMDPPRPEVAEAVKTLKAAGIRLVMITGDYGLTAESLARRVGMLSTPNSTIITGAELDELDDRGLQSLLEGEVLFARMAPENKLRLVSAFQAQGHVVAVTGDGVNDAPALRKADVGVSMGIIGTDVSKEAADIILTDDNFASIASAIAEGRAIYDNLRKFMTYIFSSNVPEVFPFFLTALFSVPPILTVALILAIDVGTDLFPALGLGVEKPEPDIMRRPPRPNKALIDSGLLYRSFLWLGMIEVVLCYLAVVIIYGLSGNIHLLKLPLLERIPFPSILAISSDQLVLMASTIFFASVVTAQLGNVFATRTEKTRVHQLGWFSNPTLLIGIAAEIAITLIIIYTPLNRFFGLQPLPLAYWAGLILFAPAIYFLEWCRKSVLRWRDVKT